MSVFLCHSSKNKEFVRELYRRLTRDGVECFLDEESIQPGENWVVALERGIGECKFLLVVLSPHFLESKWTLLERTSTMADDPEGLKRKIIPLFLEPCEVPRFLKPIQGIDVSTWANYPKLCAAVGGTPGDDRTEPVDRTELPPVAATLPKGSVMPYRSLGDKFVGRIEDLWKLRDQLMAGRTTVIQGVGVVMGTGGLGKTQLAIEYVHRFGPAYQGGVFWVEADQGRAPLVKLVSQGRRSRSILKRGSKSSWPNSGRD